MRLVLLDTDVFSFFFKQDTRGNLYAPHLAGSQACLSFQTIAEIQSWAITHHWGDVRRQRLLGVLGHYLLLPYDNAMTQHWAQVTAHRRQLGRPIDCGDAWIAATALRHDATLLTHNARHFGDIPGLSLISHAS